YGGPLLSTWLDRDLGISGRVSVRAQSLPASLPRQYDDVPVASPVRAPGTDPVGVATVLVRFDEPLLRVAQLAIHLNRSVNSEGLTLNPQEHLAPIWGIGDDKPDFAAFLAQHIGVEPADVLGFDLMTHDVQQPARIGARKE